MNRSVLIVADVKNWVFDKMYSALKNNCTHWNCYSTYISEKGPQDYCINDYNNFDLVFYLCDWNPNFLINANIPRDRVLLALRSDVPYAKNPTHSFYRNKDFIYKTVGGLVVSNDVLYDKFKDYHDFVRIASGGVDTELFKPFGVEKEFYPWSKSNLPIVGWSGSMKNFGIEYRGLDIIQEVCNDLGYKFNPAYRENRWRNEREMSEYYNNDIDIYVDMSISAGRQNGLLEAASCGKALISTNCGIASKLITDELDGFIVDRDCVSLKEGLICIVPYIPIFSENIRKKVVENWSWEAQTKIFEAVFDEFWEKHHG